MSTQRPQRLLRISKACDFCHKRRIKCQANPADPSGRCRNCAEFDIACTYTRPSRRGRGSPQPGRPPADGDGTLMLLPRDRQQQQQQQPQPQQRPQPFQQGGLQAAPSATSPYAVYAPSSTAGMPVVSTPSLTITSPTAAGRTSYASRATTGGPGVVAGYAAATTTTTTNDYDGSTLPHERLSSTWKGFAHTSTPTLRRLLAVYNETVFPIFPFFDPVHLQRRLDRFEHVNNRGFFCCIMAAGALASARARDGALSSDGPTSASPGSAISGVSLGARSGTTGGGGGGGGGYVDMPPEILFAAAEEALPKDILQCRDFDYLRALALLSLASIQDAKIAVMQKYIGHYFTLLAINQWHDEANWMQELHPIDVEERRRLYWSMYTLDVYSSIIWDGCIHFQESHAKVAYPTGRFERDEASEPGTADAPAADRSFWVVGWNFTTDLYRILEHNLNKLRSRGSKFNLLGETTTPGSFRVSSQDRVAELYAALPPVFKQLQPATGEPTHDIYGFQAANIQATMALLEMVHLSLEPEVGLEQKCSVVHNVLQTFHQVPKPYMRAISTPLIYHIGGIGVILGTVMEGPLSESSYRLVRDLLLSMAVLLESLEAFLYRSANAGKRLRNLVARLEDYYTSMRRDSVAHLQPQNNGGTNTNGSYHGLPQADTAAAHAAALSPEGVGVGGYGTTPGGARGGPGQLGTGPDTTNANMAAAVAAAATDSTGVPGAAIPPGPSTSGNDGPLPPPPPPPLGEGGGGGAPAQLPSPNTGAASMYGNHQQSNGTPRAPGGPGGPGGWVTPSTGLAPEMANMQFQLPDEFLQDWTWPFAVSNNYLSF
ncbi:Zn(2)-C6 fungal-type DNA-binding domain protein [Niveomyces insectorum RCEF 264]|uniref:Zn(2)-C6 fungal-type DNA-binding domain protein n=1 Tax=Niveomyces insectorum RCEF 264 TaxID=1081102 RepID=A0A167UR70_9HYPO|nr:Zn(2)-C6 fungal-type DNA-binding domain protein [Niveomyces insectorum RCEF 264]